MEKNETKNIITINDKEYDVDEMKPEQQYAINQIKSLNGKIANVQFELDQLRAAYDMFSNKLIQSVEEENETTND
jgi:uncharacterized coiled-coil protein SlyX